MSTPPTPPALRRSRTAATGRPWSRWAGPTGQAW